MRVDNYVSSERRITTDSGTLRLRLLFSVYVNNVSRELEVQIVLFVDDNDGLHLDRNADRAIIRLQNQLDKFFNWTDNSKVAITTTKSAAVLSSKRRKNRHNLFALVHGSQVLCVHLDRRLTVILTPIRLPSERRLVRVNCFEYLSARL